MQELQKILNSCEADRTGKRIIYSLKTLAHFIRLKKKPSVCVHTVTGSQETLELSGIFRSLNITLTSVTLLSWTFRWFLNLHASANEVINVYVFTWHLRKCRFSISLISTRDRSRPAVSTTGASLIQDVITTSEVELGSSLLSYRGFQKLHYFWRFSKHARSSASPNTYWYSEKIDRTTTGAMTCGILRFVPDNLKWNASKNTLKCLHEHRRVTRDASLNPPEPEH